MDQLENNFNLFIKNINARYPNLKVSWKIEQAVSPIKIMGGYNVIDVAARASIYLTFTGLQQDIDQANEYTRTHFFPMYQTSATLNGATLVAQHEYLISSDSLLDNYKLYELEFDRLMEEELSKKPQE